MTTIKENLKDKETLYFIAALAVDWRSIDASDRPLHLS